MTNDLSDRTILLTGGTSGFGRVAAIDLAQRGATVAVVGRDESKGATLTEQSEDFAGTIAFHQADLASQSTIRSLAATVKRKYDPIDVLAHNAGLSAGSRRESPDGIEITLAVNHLAPYLLTHELLDHLRDAPDPRVVVTASDIHRRATLDLDDLQLTDEYDSLDAYARSKLANIAFTVELDDRLPEDSAVTVNCVHPGFVPSTDLFREASLRTRLLVRIAGLVPGVATSKQAAAERLQTLLVEPTYGSMSGQYIGSDGPVDPAPEATNKTVRRRLWRMSAELVGITPDWPTSKLN
ncbi:NAD(P)-dependent dehydrogenase, short-chain alcohol dehydrogenase family [Halorubrum ezzemoulense]|uniref:NAD(P)-dependent dehydrogenase, short-chain alcohol dehydrogenase family n=1 Tax=Halorubrum ezzemoulense TaxID=337243 RepID=A0A238YVV0_HALEZ|nr:SDR family NAD(P)-dependent oxidoreductase [Halorubrum ezzemoulense]SNR74599.1 NAD(P)-dependent dehydrogenase, short-chain alcohol dehydrogenase family [Halorubrum ezzemoulense]